MYEYWWTQKQSLRNRWSKGLRDSSPNALLSRTPKWSKPPRLVSTYVSVFNNRELTLEALRFALFREKTIDLAKHVNFRNDALHYVGSVTIRLRNWFVQLEDLWLPLVKSMMPSDPMARAQRLMQMLRLNVESVKATSIYPSLNWTAVEHWTVTEFSLTNSVRPCSSNSSLANLWDADSNTSMRFWRR